MNSASDERMAQLLAQLRMNPALVGSLPGEEGTIVESALAGADIHAIAQAHEISTEAAWAIIGNAARLLSGQEPPERVEVGGLGSDTDPGINGGHGGYGATGFGAIDNEPPYPTPEEPREGDPPCLGNANSSAVTRLFPQVGGVAIDAAHPPSARFGKLKEAPCN